jgi:hypothetical protein
LSVLEISVDHNQTRLVTVKKEDGLPAAAGHASHDRSGIGPTAGDSQTDSQSGCLGQTATTPARTPRTSATVSPDGPACPDTEGVTGSSTPTSNTPSHMANYIRGTRTLTSAPPAVLSNLLTES